MPELPEVETVRDGLSRHILGSQVTDISVFREASVRRHAGGAAELTGLLLGRSIATATRRGKFIWLTLDDGLCLVAHLGMSGQLLIRADAEPLPRHLRVRMTLGGLDGGPLYLDFVDQRVFGYLFVDELVATRDELPGGLGSPAALVPTSVAHIARDALDPHLDMEALVRRLRGKRTEIKRALLDQTLVSGIGNIYADEALWQARVHYARQASGLSEASVRRVLEASQDVMRAALRAGGTSFDALYVNVNGESGYFDRSLNAYGRVGEPCSRCGSTIRREAFMNRSSFFCGKCQRRRS